MVNIYKYFTTEQLIYRYIDYYTTEKQIIEPKYYIEQQYIKYLYQFNPEINLELIFTPKYECLGTILNSLENYIRDIQDYNINVSIEEVEQEIEDIKKRYE